MVDTSRTVVVALVACVLAVMEGCTDRELASFSSYGEVHVVELYSGGRVVATFESTGKVECTAGGICDFMDATTHKLVRTTGDVVIRVK